MAVTPKGIVTPDPSSPYNLVTDLSTLASTADAAIVTQKGTASQRSAALAGAPEGTLWQDTDGIKMIWRKEGSAWVPAVWRWGGTTAQMNSFTQAPDGFEWYNSSDLLPYIRISSSWRVAPLTQSGSITLPAINANTLGPTQTVSFPQPFPGTPRYVQLNCTGFRIKPSWNFLTSTGMSVYPANVWITNNPAGETLQWRVTY